MEKRATDREIESEPGKKKNERKEVRLCRRYGKQVKTGHVLFRSGGWAFFERAQATTKAGPKTAVPTCAAASRRRGYGSTARLSRPPPPGYGVARSRVSGQICLPFPDCLRRRRRRPRGQR